MAESIRVEYGGRGWGKTFKNLQYQIMTINSEEQLQAACFQWFWNMFPTHRQMLFHVPNGGGRQLNEAARLKATGVVRGVSDFILVLPGKVVFIELKWGKGSQSEYQRSFEISVRNRGHEYYLIDTIEKFQKLVISLLHGV